MPIVYRRTFPSYDFHGFGETEPDTYDYGIDVDKKMAQQGYKDKPSSSEDDSVYKFLFQHPAGQPGAKPVQAGMPWGTIALLGGAAVVLFMFMGKK